MTRMTRPHTHGFLSRIASGLVIVVVLLGASSQLPDSCFEKGQFLIELNDQAINFSNPTKIKPSGAKDLVGHVFQLSDDFLSHRAPLARVLCIGSSERNPFYIVVTANAP